MEPTDLPIVADETTMCLEVLNLPKEEATLIVQPLKIEFEPYQGRDTWVLKAVDLVHKKEVVLPLSRIANLRRAPLNTAPMITINYLTKQLTSLVSSLHDESGDSYRTDSYKEGYSDALDLAAEMTEDLENELKLAVSRLSRE